MSLTPPPGADPTTEPRRVPAALALAAALAPALAALAWHEGFVTQDGPAHLYNAHVLARSFDPGSPFRDVFSVRWEPLPNWAGHAALMGLVSTLPARTADRLMTAATLAAFALAVLGLRRAVAGAAGSTVEALAEAALAALLGLNVAWLLGFTSFLLGAALFPATLALWWSGRDGGWSPRRAAGLAGLVGLGYFAHLVSLGLTAVGLAVLELTTPGPRRAGRAATTGVGLLPLAPLGLVYRGIMTRGGGLAPEWKHLRGGFSPARVAAQLTWVDPVSLARKDYLPVSGTVAGWHVATSPVLWLGLALALAAAGALAARGFESRTRGWWALAALLGFGGVVTPDTLGPTHGEYLPQRVVLLGLAALVPVLRFTPTGRLGRSAVGALAAAWLVQSAVVWDYARFSERTAGAVLRAGPAVGSGRRVATLLTDIPTPFRANPILHADCGLGVGTANVIWSDYETRFYYFPVQFRDGLDRPDPAALEQIALAAPGDPERLRLWSEQMARYQHAVDVVVTWNDDPALDAVTARWFRPAWSGGPVRVWERRTAR